MSPSREHSASQLLSEDENALLFETVGSRRVSLSTSVAQLFQASPDPARWTKKSTGVVCFVKDNAARSYFIRLFQISNRSCSQVYEQEIFREFDYKQPLATFHTFAGDSCQIGLNFADDEEAKHFGQQVNGKVASFHRTRADSTTDASPTAKSKPPPQRPKPYASTKPLPPQRRCSTEEKKTTPDTTAPPLPPDPPQPSQTNLPKTNGKTKVFKGKRRKKKGEKKGSRGLNKLDISGPTNFQHLKHIGWDPDEGFNSANLSSDWRSLLKTAGVTETQLQDRETAQFIFDYVEQHGGIQSAEAQTTTSSVTPILRKPRSQTENHPLGKPPPIPPARPQSLSSGVSTTPSLPPPPPPPPPLAGSPAGPKFIPPPPPPGKPPTRQSPTSSDLTRHASDGDLLSSIRAGCQLKKVDPLASRPSGSQPQGGCSMATALARALAERSHVMHSDSDDDDVDGDEGDDSDDDWD